MVRGLNSELTKGTSKSKIFITLTVRIITTFLLIRELVAMLILSIFRVKR